MTDLTAAGVRAGAIERLRERYVRTTRVGDHHEVLYFQRHPDTIDLVKALSLLEPGHEASPIFASGDLVGAGFETRGASAWLALLGLSCST